MEKGKNLQKQNKQAKTVSAKAKKLVKQNKAKMLSVAVAIAVGSHLTACSSANDASYYRQKANTNIASSSASSQVSGSYGGGGHYYGSYYYGRGSTYRSGSWGTAATIGHSTGTDNGGGTHVGG
jgi:uncharacterized membrane protein